MLRGLRRPAVLLVPAVLLSLLASACGSSTGDSPMGATANGLDAVTITGDVGSNPQVTWKSMMTLDQESTTTLVTGTGPALQKGDSVIVNYWLGNGYTEQNGVFNTFGPTNPAVDVTVGSLPVAQPQTIDDLLADTVSQFVTAGVTSGSRLAIAVRSDQLFGQNVQASPITAKNIGNEDPLLLIVDVQQPVLTGPDGASQPSPAWAPKVVGGAEPTSLDFSGVPALGSKLKVALLKKGTGAPVKSKQLIVVNYLGQVPGAAKPFDESYTKTPYAKQIGVGNFIKGWDQALVGVPVGSRVLLGIPPSLGYGSKAQQGIPASSTLYFVIDVLAAG